MLRLPPELDELIASYPDTAGAHFAYASLPLCRDLGGSLVQMLDNAVSEQDSILLITNDYEVTQHESDPPTLSHHTMVMNFASFLSTLELSLGPDGWQSRTSDELRPCLPRNAFVVLDLDPSLPSDCALTLLGLIQWAIGVETSHGASMHILVLSTADHEQLVSDLVHIRDTDRELRVAEKWPDDDCPPLDHVGEPKGNSALVDRIYDSIHAEENKTQLIISFGGECLNESLEDRLKDLRGNQLKIVDVGAWDHCHEKFNSVRFPPLGVATVLLQIPPNITILPPCFSGYNTVHVIIEERLDHTRSWHGDLGQIIEFDRILPTQHRWMQLWWAAQPGCGKKSVWSRRQSLDDFLQGGHNDHHLIEGVQLGGFMAAVYDAERWGIDPSLVLDHFIGPADRVDVTRRRLEIQGVIQNSRFVLQGKEATIFRAMLPVVAYDHCVALFICLDSDPIVRTVKVNLALLLMGRPSMYSTVHDSLHWELRANGSMVNKLVDCCAGYTKPMAAHGPLWLQLGLWNQDRYLRRCRAVDQFPSEQALQNRLGDISPSKVALDQGDFPTVELRRLELRDRLSATDVISEEQEMEAFERGDEFDEAQQHRIQGHLFRAYMHLTSTSHEVSGTVLGYTLLPSMVSFYRLSCRLAMGGSFSTVSLLNADATKLRHLFVNSEVRVKNLVFECWNWAMIPVGVVQDWMDANRPGEDLLAVLMAVNNVRREIIHEWPDSDIE